VKRSLENTRLRPEVTIALVVTVAMLVIFLLAAPAFIAFGAAVAGAITWCIWLEEHPENTEETGPQ
jgi:hypothetical protein